MPGFKVVDLAHISDKVLIINADLFYQNREIEFIQ